MSSMPPPTESLTKTIARNSYWYGFEQFFSFVAGFAASIAMARVIGPTRLGYFNYVMWLINMSALVGNMGVPATTRKYIREHRDILRRYVKSQVEAVHRIYTDKEGAMRALARYIGRNVERDVLEKTWENMQSEAVLPKKQYPSIEGIKTILASETKGKAAKPEDFFDASFIREMDQSGYIDGLYKKR